MSKPKRIFLIRHGQSEGNANKLIYREKPDYTVHLTDLGRKQAHDAGKKIKEIIGDERVKFYVSPFWRTRETCLEIEKWFGPSKMADKYEDPRLREQEWGHTTGKDFQLNMEDERDGYGVFYWRFPDGESCADVFDRVSDFMNTLHRDFQKDDFPDNVIIVTHGMAMRLFLMRWFHFTVEEFEKIRNPRNCHWFQLDKLESGDKYRLVTELQNHTVKHSYQFPNYTPLPKD